MQLEQRVTWQGALQSGVAEAQHTADMRVADARADRNHMARMLLAAHHQHALEATAVDDVIAGVGAHTCLI